MTENTPPDDPQTATNDGQPPEDEPAAIHRRLSDAGIRLNEGQSHLSAIRTQAVRGDRSNEVALAEAEALVRSLEAAHEAIDEALERAHTLTSEPERGSDESGQSEHGSEAGDESGSGMLWNTVCVDVPHSR